MNPNVAKKALKAWLHIAQRWYAQRFRAYDGRRLLAALRKLGVSPGDSVMVHSSFSAAHGFRGTIDDLISVLLEAVGPDGHLLMVSLPYRDSSFAYLQRLKRFDVRKTPSMMGMVSELFRRRPGVLRSLHPTHPILVHGPRAPWFVDGHDRQVHPCGPDTPFDRLVQADGKVLFVNAGFPTYTFFHYLEHLVGPRLPFPVYTNEVFEVPVVDADGQSGTVRTHVYEPDTIARRRFPIFEGWIREKRLIRTTKIGASTLELVRVRDTVDCVRAKAEQGEFFYDMGGLRPDAVQRPTARTATPQARGGWREQ
jgi:aminoglycoside 3-N-acetyltransferase